MNAVRLFVSLKVWYLVFLFFVNIDDEVTEDSLSIIITQLYYPTIQSTILLTEVETASIQPLREAHCILYE